MKSILRLLFVCLVFGVSVHAQQAFSCSGNREDMLKYFVMGYPDRVDHHMGPGNANPIYTSIDPDLGSGGFAAQGTFIWIKSANGYPWDVNTFDQNFIYHRSTELKWTDPTTFKRQQNDIPISPRCVAVKGAGPNLQIPPSGSVYDFYSNCQPYQTANLAYVVNTISKASLVNTGGNLGQVRTRYLTYQYACDSTYANCKAMEIYALGQNVGLYDWQSYVNQNGSWVLKQESVINQFQPGQTTPYFACPNTYQ